ncbi:Facilitated trehalose transporter Tret1, partial [Operophtera brumata]
MYRQPLWNIDSRLALGTFFQLRICGYAMRGFSSIYMIVIAELFSDAARATGMSFALTGSSITVFITSKYFASMSSAIGPGVYWICAASSFLTCIFVGIWVPETNKKTFAEIQE